MIKFNIYNQFLYVCLADYYQGLPFPERPTNISDEILLLKTKNSVNFSFTEFLLCAVYFAQQGYCNLRQSACNNLNPYSDFTSLRVS